MSLLILCQTFMYPILDINLGLIKSLPIFLKNILGIQSVSLIIRPTKDDFYVRR